MKRLRGSSETAGKERPRRERPSGEKEIEGGMEVAKDEETENLPTRTVLRARRVPIPSLGYTFT